MIRSMVVKAPKPFIHHPLDLPEMEVVEKDGKRWYEVTDGVHYPSVTTVMSATADKDFLVKWRKRVGEEQADMISSNSTARGTALHALNEQYLKNEPIEVNKHPANSYVLFKQGKPALDAHVGNIRAMENCLASKANRIAGRVDLIADWDGVLSIIDFKSSAKEKKEEWITDYFHQASLYSIMLYEMTGLMAKQLVILIAGYETAKPQIFIKNVRDYLPAAVKRVKLYHGQQTSMGGNNIIVAGNGS